MNAKTTHRWLIGGLLAGSLGWGLGGCGSTPVTHYYSLLPAAASPPSAAAPRLQFEMLPVDLPAQVDRAEMVVRQGGELTPVDTRQWAAPLANELRNAFSVALAQQLGAPDVYGLPHDAGLSTWRVKLNVQRFDSALGVDARIDAVWSLQKAGESAAAVCSSSVSEAVAPGYEALATGHQKAITAIAAQIAQSLDAAERTHAPARCPAR